MKEYSQPDGLFDLRYPGDWTINPDGSTITSQDNLLGSFVWMGMAPTGCGSTNEDFRRIVTARESNLFPSYPDYLETGHVEQPEETSVLITKQLTLDGVSSIVSSYYRKNGSLILILELWSPEEVYGGAQQAFDGIVNSLALPDLMQMSQEMTFPTSYFTYEDENFSVEVPITWQRTGKTSSTSEVTTFTAPDQHAVFQVILYTDSQRVSKSMSGEFVLVILREMYTRDIVVDSDIIRADGSEQLQWKSEQAGYQGVTTFDVSGNRLVMNTILYDTGFERCSAAERDHISSTFIAK